MSFSDKDLKKYYVQFNKEFFNNELPEVEIKVEKMKGKDAVGEFNYTASLKHQDGKKEKFFDIKKAVFNKHATAQQEDEWQDIIADSYIAIPKETVKGGKYVALSVLLHEMTHVWQRLVSKSMEQEDHGHDFKKKVDEINKKSKNEWRVGYTELDSHLVSDKPIDERPEDTPDELNESIGNLFMSIYNEALLGEDSWQVTTTDSEGNMMPCNKDGGLTGTPKVYSSKAEAETAKQNFESEHEGRTFVVTNNDKDVKDRWATTNMDKIYKGRKIK